MGLAVGDHDVGVVQEPVQQADRGGVFGQEPAPGFEGPVAGDAQGAAFVGGGDEPEQQLRAGVVQRGEPDFVADEQVVAEQGVDDSSDAVVGQAAVEGFDELGGGEVADSVPGAHGGDTERDQEVALAGAGRSDQGEVLPGGDPFQRGEVVQGGGRDAGHGAVELVEGLDHRERCGLEPGGGVGGVAGGDLGLDEGAQQFLGCPPLGLRGAQQFRGELAYRGQLEPAQPVDQVGGQRWYPLLRTALQEASGLLDWESVRHYEALDPGNAKMRGLVHDILDRGAWKLAWLPPSMAYYSPAGAFADSELRRFTKRLVFSAWAVVPKAIAVVLSYEAERRGVAAATSDRTYDGTRPAALLRFQIGAGGRPTGMPALGLLYPCTTLARLGDPLELTRASGQRLPARRDDVLAEAERRVAAQLVTLPDPTTETRVDLRWYWAAPMLLDRDLLGPAHDVFLRRIAGSDHDEGDQQSRFGDHVRAALTVEASSLGRRPDDLAIVLARMAIAGPGVCTLRALSRSCGGTSSLTDPTLRKTALSIASGLRSLFNRPEISTLLRAGSDESYWLSVLDHCVDGNLQAVLDEYLLVLAESESLQGLSATARAEGLRTTATSALRVRTASPHVDDIRVSNDSIDIAVHSVRTHFAVPYGRASAEDTSTIQRSSDVRTAFNSPFWPFVLASTSVGQEGLDFHHYCHAVVHWNLPGNPVDLEQREGRVHRYKGHAIRKNVAATHSDAALRTTSDDPWQAMFAEAHDDRADGSNDLTPFWMYPIDGGAAIDRYVPAMPLSRESQHYQRLLRTVGAYRLVLGQPRQEDLLRYLGGSTTADLDKLRIDLAPPAPTGLFDRGHTEVVAPDDEEEERSVTIRNAAERGIDHVIAELRSRGAAAGRVPASRRNEILVRRTDGVVVTVRIKTRTGGTWQGTINDGDPEPVRDSGRFVVFVDLAERPATCYVAPDWWFQMDVHRDHSAYLARHPGPRPSTHHAIQLSRIVAWRERWDLLGLGEQQLSQT